MRLLIKRASCSGDSSYPWAVHSAQSFAKGRQPELTPTQKSILEALEENGPTEPKRLCERVGLEEKELEREIAALRHMEKVRGELKDGKKRFLLRQAAPK